MGDELGLLPQRGSEFVTVVGSGWRLGSSFADDTIELFFNSIVLRGRQPDLVPILALREMSRDDVNHMLGGVDMFWARSPVATKVASNRVAVLANVAKVHCLTALSEEKKGIKLREELGRGLVNGDEDGLAVGSQLPQEPNGVVRRLSVKTRSRLIKEDQDARLRDQFDANSNTLALFDAQTGADLADQGIRKIMKFQKVNDSVNILELLLARSVTALSKKGREL